MRKLNWRRQPARTQRQGPAWRRLAVEQLEDRWLLTDYALVPVGEPFLALTGDAPGNVESHRILEPRRLAYECSAADATGSDSNINFTASYTGYISVTIPPGPWGQMGDEIPVRLAASFSSSCDLIGMVPDGNIYYMAGYAGGSGGGGEILLQGEQHGSNWTAEPVSRTKMFLAVVGQGFEMDFSVIATGVYGPKKGSVLAFDLAMDATVGASNGDDIVMLETKIDANDRATDHQTVKFDYFVEGNRIHAFDVGLYRSADNQYDPGEDQAAGELVPIQVAGPGHYTGQWQGLLPPDPAHPYVLAVADPANEVDESAEDNNTAYFRKYVIGAVTHGYELWGGWTDWQNHWGPAMASALKEHGNYDDAFAFSWLSWSNDPVPGRTTLAGKEMLSAVIDKANALIAREGVAPNDAIDVHWIGWSRGAVVISEALDRFAANPGAVPTAMRRGYVKMTMVDAHPARNVDAYPYVRCSYGPGLGTFLYHQVKKFQERAKDPEPRTTFAHEAEAYYQETDHSMTPPGSPEQWINLHGETVLGAKSINCSEEPYEGGLAGHGQVPYVYLERFKSASQMSLAGRGDSTAASATSDVDFLYPEYVDDRSVAETLVADVTATIAALEDNDVPAAIAGLNQFLQTVEAERPHIEAAMADWLTDIAELFVEMLNTSLLVTVNQAAGQADPTSDSPIHFTAVFSGPVADFTKEDVSLGGTAGATTVVVTPDGVAQTFDIAVRGMRQSGSVTVTIPADVAHDGEGVGNLASTSDDNSVSYIYVGPSFRIDGPQPVAEGNKAALEFNVHLTRPVNQTVKVTYTTIQDTAGVKDYKRKTGTLTFSPGKPLVQTIRVSIVDDKLHEAPETFQVALSGATAGIPIAVATATGTILDNDPMPGLSIRDISVREGKAGTTKATFTVTLSAASGTTTTVAYATADGTATLADGDYQGASGPLSFAPGVTKQTIAVLVNRDTKYELSETLTVRLSSAVNATLLRDAAQATIKNDDAKPKLSIANVTVDEAAGVAEFLVTLSAPSGLAATVNYTTAAKTALSPADFAAASGTLTLAPGSTTAKIFVPIVDDALREGDEVFRVMLSGAAGATLARSMATGTILDNDPPPTFRLDNALGEQFVDELANFLLGTDPHARRPSRTHASRSGG